MLTEQTLDNHAEAIRAHERAVGKLRGGHCAPGCPHEHAPQVEEVRAALGDQLAFEWGLFLAGEGEW